MEAWFIKHRIASLCPFQQFILYSKSHPGSTSYSSPPYSKRIALSKMRLARDMTPHRAPWVYTLHQELASQHHEFINWHFSELKPWILSWGTSSWGAWSWGILRQGGTPGEMHDYPTKYKYSMCLLKTFRKYSKVFGGRILRSIYYLNMGVHTPSVSRRAVLNIALFWYIWQGIVYLILPCKIGVGGYFTISLSRYLF